MTGQRPQVLPPTQAAMPEWLHRRDDDPSAWEVQTGQPVRGDAWTNITDRKMRVPFGVDERSRLVRAHEMMHAKVSPKIMHPGMFRVWNIDEEVIRSAEEFRVNMLTGVAGFDLNHLADGSESNTGKILGQTNDWNAAVTFMAAIAGTKAATDFRRGMRTSNPEMEQKIAVVEKGLKKMWRKHLKASPKKIGHTAPMSVDVDDEGGTVEAPYGFITFTRQYADFIQRFIVRPGEEGDGGEGDEDGVPDLEDIKDRAREGENGAFGRLIELHLPKPKKVDGRIGRKRVAANIGRNPRRMGRMLTDPEKRVFDKRVKGQGGVVLIDQSGSMRLSDDDIWAIIKAAPGCVIIGYSHRPGSVSTPNIWVIADRGSVADSLPEGNGGNGVDGPAIQFAAKRRRPGEPFIWVCDGIVTDGAHDRAIDALEKQCATLVARHGIHMVESVAGAVQALQSASGGKRLPTKAVGRVAIHHRRMA